jgi:hypothetical protein
METVIEEARAWTHLYVDELDVDLEDGRHERVRVSAVAREGGGLAEEARGECV